MVLGSTCFAKRYGSTNALGLPSYSAGGGGGGTLDEAERQMLMENTAALMALFKERQDSAMALAEAKLRALRERATQHHAARRVQLAPTYTRPLQSLPQHPWPWQHQQNTSVGVVRGADGQCWVRVQHRDGSQKIAPWPVFDGWDEALPLCGRARPLPDGIRGERRCHGPAVAPGTGLLRPGSQSLAGSAQDPPWPSLNLFYGLPL
ncbi:hypothetical protein ACHFCA_26460 [Delftia tsuruhatensis]